MRSNLWESIFTICKIGYLYVQVWAGVNGVLVEGGVSRRSGMYGL